MIEILSLSKNPSVLFPQSDNLYLVNFLRPGTLSLYTRTAETHQKQFCEL